MLPLLDRHHDDDSLHHRRRRKGRGFRMASRCQVSAGGAGLQGGRGGASLTCFSPQVVKVSHATQTVRLLVPSVRPPEATPPGAAPVNLSTAAEHTPSLPWRRLPPSYTHIVTPVQPRTSLVYLLSSPCGSAPSCSPCGPTPSGAASRRSRKKRRPLDLQGLKVKYRRGAVRLYDPGANRILQAPPPGRSPAASGPPPPCVRQLFRSLSPDLNSDRTGEGPHAAGGRGRAAKAAERGRSRRTERPRPLASRKRTRAQAPPPPPRREGLRRLAPAVPAHTPQHSPSGRRGRGRRRGRSRT